MAVPSRIRERVTDAFGSSLVVTVNPPFNGIPRSLMVYPSPAWRDIEEKIQALPSFDPGAQRLRHLLIGRASECDMDSHGRILLPAVLREWAGLDKKVRMIGQGHRFEIWDEATWVDYSSAIDVALEDDADQSAVISDLVL